MRAHGAPGSVWLRVEVEREEGAARCLGSAAGAAAAAPLAAPVA